MKYDSIEGFQSTLQRRINYLQHQWRLAIRTPLRLAVKHYLLTEDKAQKIITDAKTGFDTNINLR